jgi:phage terminase large subunit-like protein
MGQSLRMARRSPGLAAYVKVQKYLVEGVRTGGVMRALASDGGLQHGLNPSCSIIDEVHAHKNDDLYTALTTGTGAREQPLTFWITTAGKDEENLLASLHGQMFAGPGELEQRSDSLLIYRDRDAGVYIWWYGAQRDADIEDPAVWARCNPASWLQDGSVLRRDFGKLKPKGKLLEWRIYHLNQIMGTEESWLPDGAWAARAEGEPDADDRWHGLDPSLPVGVGIEKAAMSDAGAIVVAQRQGERMLVRAQHFAAEGATGRVSVEGMRIALRELRGRFEMPQMRDPKTKRPLPGPAYAFDRWAFEESAESLEQEGLDMVDFPQTAGTMGPASTSTFELITTGRLAHDGDPVLAKHVEDSTALLTERGMKVIKGKKRPNHGCVAMVMAVAMAMQEAPKPRAPRVYGGF